MEQTNFKNWTKTIDIPIKSYSEEDIPLMNRMIEDLFINIYGEATREDGIFFGNFNYDFYEGKVCYMIASMVKSVYGYQIYIECSFWKYLKFLYQTHQLKSKNKVQRIKKKDRVIRNTKKWVLDISNAYNKPIEYWIKIWEFLNEK